MVRAGGATPRKDRNRDGDHAFHLRSTFSKVLRDTLQKKRLVSKKFKHNRIKFSEDA